MAYIYIYTRADAFNDGVLVDISNIAQKVGFRCSVAVTDTVYNAVESAANPPFFTIDSTTLHILVMLKNTAGKESEILFDAILPTGGVKLKAIAGPGDNGEMVVTIMYPEED